MTPMDALIAAHIRITARWNDLQDRIDDPEAGGSTLENAVIIGGLVTLAVGLLAVVSSAVDTRSGAIR